MMLRFVIVVPLVVALCMGPYPANAEGCARPEEAKPGAGTSFPPPNKEAKEKRIENARKVLAAIVQAADANYRLPPPSSPPRGRDKKDLRTPFRRSGDELTVYYIRAAAAAAR